LVKRINLKIITISLLAVLLLSSFSLLFINVFNMFKSTEHDNPNAEADLTIKTFAQLQSFANNVKNGYNYAGETVELGANIDCDGASIEIGRYSVSDALKLIRWYFAGTFDGKGYTISNITNSFNPTWISDYNLSFDRTNHGLFINNSGTIKNLKLENYNLTLEEGMTSQVYAGALVGYNTGTVEDCVVKNIKILSDRWQMYARVGAIVGENNGSGKVNRCVVAGYYKIGGVDDNVLSNNDGLEAAYFVGRAISGEATNSVFVATVEEIQVTSMTKSPSEWDGGAVAQGSGNYTSASGARSAFASDMSSIGGASETTTWYYGGDSYYGGLPVPRGAISWQLITLGVSNPKDVSLKIDGIKPDFNYDYEARIYIPSDANPIPTSFTETDESGGLCQYEDTFWLCNREIYAYSLSECYVFDKWGHTPPGANQYIKNHQFWASRKRRPITYKFMGNFSTSHSITSQKYSANCGTYIYIEEYIPNVSITFQTWIDGSYKDITYKANNAYYITGAYYKIGDTEVKIDLNETSIKLHDHDGLGTTIEIHVTTQRKSYDVWFG